MTNIIFDLCIVGAGMYGSAAARHASAHAGMKVCLIGAPEPEADERRNREIFGAHYDEGRITCVLNEDLPTQILSKHSISRYRELEQLSGIQFYHPVGFLNIGKKGSPDISRLMLSAEMGKIPVVDLSYNEIFRTRFPYIKIRADDHPLLDDGGAGHISPRNMVAAQKIVAKEQGCYIIEDIVEEVKPLTKDIHEIHTEKGKLIRAKRVLFCTGAFTNFKKFPIPNLKIQRNKETVALFRISKYETSRWSTMPAIIYSRPEEKVGFYILPPIEYPNGNFYLKIGHIDYEITEEMDTLIKVKNWYLSNGDEQKFEPMLNFISDILPGVRIEDIASATCVSSGSPSGLPYIDRISPTLTVAIVGKGKGAKISEEVGRIAATLSLSGKWDSELPKTIFSAILDD